MSAQRGSAYGDAGRCEFCGVELRKRPGTAGRPARYCSGTCRQRARRRRMAAEKVAAGRTPAGQILTADGDVTLHGPGRPETPPAGRAPGEAVNDAPYGGAVPPQVAAGARGLAQAAAARTVALRPAGGRATGTLVAGGHLTDVTTAAAWPPPGHTTAAAREAAESAEPAESAATRPAAEAARPAAPAGETAAADGPPPTPGARPAEAPPATGGAVPPTSAVVPVAMVGLPAPLDAFVGREDEIAELKALLAVARLVTLLGPAGAGKTRLALELAARVSANHPDGVWLVELAGLTDGGRLAHRVAESLGVEIGPDRRPGDGAGRADGTPPPVERALVERLRPGRTLLILDNCEHVVDESAHLAVTLLRACPGLTVLATSRQPLDAPGEHLYPVHGLSLPAEQSPRTRGELLRSDAVRLFVERARAVSPAFELTRENGDEIAEMCARLDGNPLAIELAARLARLRPISHILDRLDDRLHLLTQGTRTAEQRHRNLRTAIEWSYELLDPDEQRLFRRLSVLAGWFTAEDALRVCGEELTADAALHLLGRLETSSLLVTEYGRPGGRFRMMESIRLYAQERLAAAGEEADAYERLVTWLLDVAAPVVGDRRLLRSARDLDPLAARHDTLRHALDRATRRGDDRRALLATALAHCLLRRGDLDEARRVLRAALGGVDPAFPGRATALACAGVLAALDGHGDQAIDLVTEAITLARADGRPIVLARALLALATVRRCLGDLAEADRALRECLALLGTADPMDLAAVLHERARLAVLRGDLDDARARLDRCLSIHGDLHGDPVSPGAADEAEPAPHEWTHTAATLALLAGDLDDADRRWRDILAAYRAPDAEPPALALEAAAGLAVVAARGGDALRAMRLAAAAGVLGDGHLRRAGTIPAAVIGEAVADARSALSPAAASAATRDGERLGGHDLVTYALDGTWTEPADDHAAEPVLTERERQVAFLVAEGLANRQIARRLHVSERTVHTHLERIRTKLGLPSRTHIVRWVVEEGGTPD